MYNVKKYYIKSKNIYKIKKYHKISFTFTTINVIIHLDIK